MVKISKFIKEEKGSIAPLTAVILILCIGLGAVNIALSMLYRDRTAVRDALDAACTSSLVAATDERWRSLRYLEDPIVNIDNNFQVLFEYFPYEEKEKSYIYINRDKAELVAKEVFEQNLKLSGVPYKINDFTIDIEYEPHEESKETVLKERYEVSTQPENWWITEELYNANEVIDKPDSWNVNIPWDNKSIKFPRWVKVKAIANIELKTPFAKIVKGTEAIDISMRSESVKELDTDTREEQEIYTGY